MSVTLSRISSPHCLFTLPIILLAIVLCSLGCSGPQKPSMDIFEAIGNERVDIVQQHMDWGTDPDQSFVPASEDWAGASALHIAALVNNKTTVSILLEHGANIDIKAWDTFQGTPLEWVAFFGVKEMVVYLVEQGADINAKNLSGTTPYDAASIANPFINPNDTDEFNENREFIKSFLKENGGKYGKELQ